MAAPIVTNPDEVVRYASAVGKSYDEAGLWYSYKHFPGIGKTDVDLHADTSIVPVSKETLLSEDTKVFVDLIKQSKPNTYTIMVSHAMYPQIDPDHPSSLSKTIITDWLRKDMGYNGVVVTDDMDMGCPREALHLRRYGGAIHPRRQRYLARMPRIRTPCKRLTMAL